MMKSGAMSVMHPHIRCTIIAFVVGWLVQYSISTLQWDIISIVDLSNLNPINSFVFDRCMGGFQHQLRKTDWVWWLRKFHAKFNLIYTSLHTNYSTGKCNLFQLLHLRSFSIYIKVRVNEIKKKYSPDWNIIFTSVNSDTNSTEKKMNRLIPLRTSFKFCSYLSVWAKPYTQDIKFQWQIIIFNHINRSVFIMSFMLIFSMERVFFFFISPLLQWLFFWLFASLFFLPRLTFPPICPLCVCVCVYFRRIAKMIMSLSWCHNLDHFYSLGWYLISFSGHSIPFRKLSGFLAAWNFFFLLLLFLHRLLFRFFFYLFFIHFRIKSNVELSEEEKIWKSKTEPHHTVPYRM